MAEAFTTAVVRHADPWSTEWRSYWRPHLVSAAELHGGSSRIYDATTGHYAGGVVLDAAAPCFWWCQDPARFPRFRDVVHQN